MPNERLFQFVTLTLFGIFAAIGFTHRLRAAKADDKISRREEGLPIMILLRFFGFAAWIGLIIYIINPMWMSWSTAALPGWLRWLGAGIVAVTIPLIYWMFRSLGNNVTDTVTIRQEHRLVVNGPYRWVRHPMYTFTLLMFGGFSLLTANWFIAVAGALTLFLLVARTPIEEAKLTAKFGAEYRAYMQRTGRFFPRLASSQNK